MLKTLLKSAAAPLVLLAVTGTSALAAPPAVTPVMLLANPATGGSDAASGEAAIMEMFSKLFDPGEQAPIDAAQLALGQTTAARLLPEGAYGRMMEQMMGQFIKPILAMEKSMSGMQIAGKTGIDAAAAEALTEQQRDAVLAILDPGREARNDGMMAVLKPLMVEAGKALEAPMREGLARAYARKFSAAQLADVNSFFATPGGAAFAAESFAIQADPEVLSATFKAMPVMFTKFMGSATDLEAKMKALPQERKLSALSEDEIKQLAALLGTSADALKNHAENGASPMMMADDAVMTEGGDAAEVNAEATSEAAAADPAPWYNRISWSDQDVAKVEALEQKISAIIGEQIEAEDAAVERARVRLQSAGEKAPGKKD